MGIARLSAKYLLHESVRLRRPYGGSVLQLGRQDIHFGDAELGKWAAAAGFALDHRRPPTCGNPRRPGSIDDVTFFSRLGFDKVHSCDASNHEGAEFLLNLNATRPPPHLLERFDLIFDGGTIEHVFDVPAALTNVHAMLKVGGRVVHAAPTSNYVDHGFYMFSPTLFWDYYEANGYQIDGAYLAAHSTDHQADGAYYRYVPGSLDALSFGGCTPATFGERNNLFACFFTATKLAGSTSGVVPTQRAYRRMWRSGGGFNAGPRRPLQRVL